MDTALGGLALLLLTAPLWFPVVRGLFHLIEGTPTGKLDDEATAYALDRLRASGQAEPLLGQG